MKKKSLEQEINEFLNEWDLKRMHSFAKDVIPLIELYNVDEDSDWVKDAVGELNERNVRLIRTVYLVSKIAEFHTGSLSRIKCDFKDLWKKMEAHGISKQSE